MTLNLVKTSILSFIATAVKMLAGLVINKAVALFIGPSGLAVIGQFQNSFTLISILAQGGINSGVVKYTAESAIKEDSVERLWSTSLKLTLLFSFIVSLLLIIFSKGISKYIFATTSYQYVLIILGATLTLFTLNQLFLSILNGLKEIRLFISINISQNIYGLVFTTLLIYYYHLDGALIGLVTNQAVIFFVVIWRLRNHKIITLQKFRAVFDSDIAKRLLHYSLMALASAITLPLSQIIVRNYVVNKLSWEHAGYWQGMTYISTMYLMVITTALSIYYLPRLSEITEKRELRQELFNGYKFIIPLVSLMALVAYLIKDFLTVILFSEDFSPMLELFKWQMIGDVIKIIAWLLSYIMVAKAMTKQFIITEMVFSVSYCFFSMAFVNYYGFVGLSYAFALNYFIYLIIVSIIMRKHLF